MIHNFEITDKKFINDFVSYLKKWGMNISDSDFSRKSFHKDLVEWREQKNIQLKVGELCDDEIVSTVSGWLFMWKHDADVPYWTDPIHDDGVEMFERLIGLVDLSEAGESDLVHFNLRLTDDQFGDIINYMQALDEAMSL